MYKLCVFWCQTQHKGYKLPRNLENLISCQYAFQTLICCQHIYLFPHSTVSSNGCCVQHWQPQETFQHLNSNCYFWQQCQRNIHPSTSYSRSFSPFAVQQQLLLGVWFLVWKLLVRGRPGSEESGTFWNSLQHYFSPVPHQENGTDRRY